jgi:translation elongation factor EF-1beta
MKITQVTIRRLKSHSIGFGHVAVELTAEVDHEKGETPEQVIHDLRDRVDEEVRQYLEVR